MKNASPNHMIIPVTDKLREELAATARVLSSVDQDAHSKLNDQQHYRGVADQLEALTVTVLGATTSTPMTNRSEPLGARFALASGHALNNHLVRCVAYLRDDASELLAVGSFSRYETKHLDVATGLLKQLNGMILSGIIEQAEADLAAIRSGGVGNLIVAAQSLAAAASRHYKQRNRPDDTRPA